MRDLAGAPGRDIGAPVPVLYTAAEAAEMLRCSAWWLKKEARDGRAPHTRTGGAYKFTVEHIAAIIRLREVSASVTGPAVPPVAPVRRAAPGVPDTVPLLRARRPRRARRDMPGSVAA
ncbi:helix-turn-helix domain-containing protein [Dactylosporangium sp. NPDC049140]|uniref:helix-turn-helix domain-containing protein n=1 Tax=Dactylosporangium sp. NPDC049140 TaxID=3155647 RepID=UPI0033EB16B0